MAVEHLEQQRTVRVHRCLGLVDLAVVDQRLHPAVVVGQPVQGGVAVEVGTAVADVGQAQLVTVEQGAGDGGAHPVQREVGLDEVGDTVVGPVQRPRQHVEHLRGPGGRLDLLDRVDRHGRGQVPGGGPTHPVGDDEQVRACIAGVLVVLADQPDFGVGDVAQGQGHRVTAPA